MAKKSIRKNYIFNVCYQMLLLITPLITTPYVSRVLGADGIGTISYAESIVSYFSLIGILGITTYGQREISYVQDSVKKRSSIFWNTKILQLCTAGTAMIAYIVYIYLKNKSAVYYVLSFNILAVMMDITWFFQGMEEFGKIVFRNAVFKLLNIIFIFVFIKAKDDIILYTFGHSFFLFLSNISLWPYLPKYISRVEFLRLRPFKNIKVIISLFVPTVAIQIYTVMDKTMIGVITQNPYENGFYEQALKISKMVLTIITALGTVMIPRIGCYFENNKIEEVTRLMYKGYRFVWFLGIPLSFGLIMISTNFVPWFFSDGYEKVIPLLNILSLLILAIGISNVTGMQYLIPTKRQNMLTLSVVTGACINFILNLILIPLYQSIGAAIASVAAEIAIAIIQLILVHKKLSFLKILKEGTHYYIAGTIMALFLWIIRRFLPPSFLCTFILILSGAIIYTGILFIIKDEFLVSNIKMVLKKIKAVS